MRTISCSLLILLATSVSTARRSSTTADLRTKVLSTPRFITGSFDTNQVNLPPSFAGHDIRAIYRALTNADVPRGVLETADAYAARIRAAVPEDRLIAFVGRFSGFTQRRETGVAPAAWGAFVRYKSTASADPGALAALRVIKSTVELQAKLLDMSYDEGHLSVNGKFNIRADCINEEYTAEGASVMTRLAILGAGDPKQPVGTAQDASMNVQVQFTYDPDTEQLTLWPELDPTIRSGAQSSEPRLPFAPVASTVVRNERFLGQNAFGTSVKVSYLEMEIVGIVPTNAFRRNEDGQRLIGTFPVPRDRAASILEKADRTLLVGRLERPVSRPITVYESNSPVSLPIAFDGVWGNSATIDSPYSFLTRQQCVGMRIEGIWLFNSRTGEILSRVTVR